MYVCIYIYIYISAFGTHLFSLSPLYHRPCDGHESWCRCRRWFDAMVYDRHLPRPSMFFFLICRWYIYICTYYIYRYIYYIWHILICRCRWQIGACHLNMFAGHQRNLWVHWCSQWSAMLQTARALVDMPDGSYGSGAVWKSRVPWNGSGSILGKLVT